MVRVRPHVVSAGPSMVRLRHPPPVVTARPPMTGVALFPVVPARPTIARTFPTPVLPARLPFVPVGPAPARPPPAVAAQADHVFLQLTNARNTCYAAAVLHIMDKCGLQNNLEDPENVIEAQLHNAVRALSERGRGGRDFVLV